MNGFILNYERFCLKIMLQLILCLSCL